MPQPKVCRVHLMRSSPLMNQPDTIVKSVRSQEFFLNKTTDGRVGSLPKLGVSIPVSEFYQSLALKHFY